MDFITYLIENDEYSNKKYESDFAERRHLFLIQKARSTELNRFIHYMNDNVGGEEFQVSDAWINRFSSSEVQADAIRTFGTLHDWFVRFPEVIKDLPKLEALFLRMLDAKYKFEDFNGNYTTMRNEMKAGRKK